MNPIHSPNGRYVAKPGTEGGFNVYDRDTNLRMAVMAEDGDSVRFFDKYASFAPDHLRQLATLMELVARQYETENVRP